MKRSLIHQRIKQTALAVPAAALMLGAAHAGTTIGLNFQSFYYDSGTTPQTVGFGFGYQTTGFPVTARAFGVSPANWFNTDPFPTSTAGVNGTTGRAYGGTLPISTSISFNSLTLNMSSANMWESDIGNLENPANEFGGPASVLPGNDEVTWSFEDNTGWTNTLSGLHAVFPNGYALALIGASKCTSSSQVTFTDGATFTNSLPFNVVYTAGNSSFSGPVGVLATPTLTNDSITFGGIDRAVNFGQSCALAGFIATDQPIVAKSPDSGTFVTGQAINLVSVDVGVAPLSYQWRSNGIPISGATAATYSAANSSVGTFNYDVVVTNLYGSTTSSVATVSIVTPVTLTWDANTGTSGAQDGAGTWDNGVTANWWNGSSDVVWSGLANAVFGSGGSGAYTVNVVSNVLANSLTFGSANYTLAGAGSISLAGISAITANTNTTISVVLSGTGNVTKGGSGNLTVTTANSLSGNLTVNGGSLQGAVSGQAFYLGNVAGNRTITVNPGASIVISNNNIFGGGGYTAAGIPAVVLNGGTFFSSRYNSIGNVTLNSGGTLSQAASDSGSYLGYQFLGTITAGGSSPSTISSLNGKGNHLLGGGVNVFSIADVTGDANPDLIVSAPLVDGSGDYTGIGSIVKTGSGTLLLSGVSTYTGTTTVSNGTLAVSGELNGGGSITLEDGTGLSVSAALGVANISASTLSIGASGTGANTLTFANLNSTSQALINAGGGLAITNPTTVNITGNITAVGTYPLLQYSGESGPGSFVLGSLPAGVSATLTDDHSSLLSLNVTVTPVQTEFWTGTANGIWNVNNTANWTVGAGAAKWFDANIAQFDDTASGTTAITLNTNVYPSSVNFSNLVKSYSLSGTGAIAGASSLYLIGTGTVTLGNTNTYTGGTFVNGGTLAVSSDANLGSGAINLNNGTLDVIGTTAFTSGKSLILGGSGGTVQVDNPAGATFTPIISGSGGSLTKSGNGTLTLGTQETYSGGTTVNAGTLVLSYGGASGTLQGPLTINTNATVLCAVNNALGYSGANWVQNITINYGTLSTAVAADNGWGLGLSLTGGNLATTVPGGYFAMGAASTVTVNGVNVPSTISADMTVRDSISFSINRGTAPVDLLVSGNLRNASSGGVTIGGNGITQFSGNNNTYIGTTEVQGGTLILSGRLTGGGAVTVDDGAELDVVGGASSAISGTGTLTLGGGGTVTLGFANISRPTVPLVSVANVALNDVTTVNISGKVAVGQFPLIKYSVATNGTGSFVLGTLPAGVSATLSNNVANQSFDLIVTTAPLSIITDISSGTNYAYAGTTYTLAVAAGGTPTLSYQWYYNNAVIPGANTSSLVLTRVSSANNGSYYVIVSNGSSISSSTNHLVVLPVSGYPAMTIATGPTAYWPLNESSGPVATDYMGGHNGAYSSGGVTYNIAGPVGGNVITVNGSSGQVTSPYSTDLNPSGAFTAEAWLAPATVTSSLVCALSSVHVGTPRAGWLIYMSTAGWEFRTYNQNGTSTAVDITGGTPTAGVWNHVAVVWDGTKGYIYVNGVLKNTSAATTYVPNADSPVTIGSRSDSAFYWPGSVGDVALYNRVLTPQEIQTHAQNSPALQINPAASKVVVSWVPSGGGSLLASPTVNGTYTNVPSATSPWTNAPSGSQQFYRVGF